MRRNSRFTLASFIVLLSASPLLAQDDAGTAALDVSFFKAFLFPSSDIIGLGIIWGLLVFSGLSIGYTIKLMLNYRRPIMLPPETAEHIEQLLSEKKFRDAIEYAKEDPSFLATLTCSALEEAPNGYGAMERAIEESADVEISRMVRPIELLNVLGNIAPMVGLFGTVYGMILAFQQLVAAGGKPDAGSLAGGISTALVTTFWGLVVAIPALAAYALIRNRIDTLTSEGIVLTEGLIRTFKPGGKKKDTSTGGDSSDSDASATGRPRATPKPESPA